MLDLTVAMLNKSLLLLLFIPLFTLGFSPLNQQGNVGVDTPSSGEILKGVVEIKGTAAGEGFLGYELAYAYVSDEGMTWFPIIAGNQPVNAGDLGNWDTSTITDGDYALKLTVHYSSSEDSEIIVQPILVRNYTSAPQASPEPSTDLDGFTSTSVAAVTPAATRTVEKRVNPAELRVGEYKSAVIAGLVAGLCLIVVLILYNTIRRAMR